MRVSMPLTVYSCVNYVPMVDGPRTQDHWTALHFAKAIKGTPLAGYATLSTPVVDPIRIDRTTACAAPEWFARLAVTAVPWRDLLPCGLVPIPDAACDLVAARRPRMFALAEALASAVGFDVAVCDVLRWSRPMSPAHIAADARDPQVLYGRLRLTNRAWLPAGQRLVLLDDVVASGAHLRAAAAFLRDCRAEVSVAICAARASDELPRSLSPLSPCVHVLPDFHPDPDWLLPETVDGIEL
jgi:adenine/guanine phosphoribosyltransferase-like PRPP-binding protein